MNDHRISRRSFLTAAGMAGAAAALTACGGAASSAASSVASSEAAQSVELIVFAAASLTETLNAIGESYTAEHPEVTFRFNFDSSGTLKTQIQEGADCDLFISAGQKQMNQLDITASADVNKDGLDFVDADSRVNLLENKVVLCVPEGTTQVTEGSVDAGVVYCTDAYSAGLTPVDEATKEMCGQVIYPAAVLKAAPNAETAKEFLAYLQTDKAMTVFEGVGFSAV